MKCLTSVSECEFKYFKTPRYADVYCVYVNIYIYLLNYVCININVYSDKSVNCMTAVTVWLFSHSISN